MTLLPIQSVGNEPHYVVQATVPGGDKEDGEFFTVEETLWINADTFLPLQLDSTTVEGGTTWTFHDYNVPFDIEMPCAP